MDTCNLNVLVNKKIRRNELSKEESELIRTFRSLTDSDKEVAGASLDGIAAHSNSQNEAARDKAA